MKLADLARHAGEWLRGGGPMHDVVISSRARLARNLAGMPFLPRCTEQQQAELEARLRREILAAGIAPGTFYVDVAAAGELDRRLLVERHLISRHHADAKHPRGVAIGEAETVAVMVNEEDHLRMQVLRTGLQLSQAVQDVNRVDDLLEQRAEYAFHPQYGYLTACPTNVGTGLRVSVMLHLPALKITGQIQRAFRAAQDLHLAVRGLYGEGTEATGDFFQISNQVTLGMTEAQIVDGFLDRTVPRFVEYERRAREALVRKKAHVLDDRIARSLALLRSARVMSCDEGMYLLSLVRLGVHLGRAPDVDLEAVNALVMLIQPAHLQRILGRQMDEPERDQARAELIRRRLGGG